MKTLKDVMQSDGSLHTSATLRQTYPMITITEHRFDAMMDCIPYAVIWALIDGAQPIRPGEWIQDHAGSHALCLSTNPLTWSTYKKDWQGNLLETTFPQIITNRYRRIRVVEIPTKATANMARLGRKPGERLAPNQAFQRRMCGASGHLPFDPKHILLHPPRDVGGTNIPILKCKNADIRNHLTAPRCTKSVGFRKWEEWGIIMPENDLQEAFTKLHECKNIRQPAKEVAWLWLHTAVRISIPTWVEGPTQCPMCKKALDTQIHLLECPQIQPTWKWMHDRWESLAGFRIPHTAQSLAAFPARAGQDLRGLWIPLFAETLTVIMEFRECILKDKATPNQAHRLGAKLATRMDLYVLAAAKRWENEGKSPHTDLQWWDTWGRAGAWCETLPAWQNPPPGVATVTPTFVKTWELTPLHFPQFVTTLVTAFLT